MGAYQQEAGGQVEDPFSKLLQRVALLQDSLEVLLHCCLEKRKRETPVSVGRRSLGEVGVCVRERELVWCGAYRR